MKRETWIRKKLRASLKLTLDTVPDARLLKLRYNTLRFTLLPFYPSLGAMDKSDCLEMLKAVVYLDRMTRLETAGQDKEAKTVASQEFQLEMGAEVSLTNNIKLLKENETNS